ncbi:MAG: hypothetical protein KGQ41_03855 [Alphaproteobacteria bacterium]|nr:hypothetical protein [Alphaproteobacteria bacterium]
MLDLKFTGYASKRLPAPMAQCLREVRQWLVSPEPLSANTIDKPFDQLHIYNGPCGFIQCLIGYRLQDKGYIPRPFALHPLQRMFGHVALTAEFAGEHYLADPSFFQFELDIHPDVDTDTSPVRKLAKALPAMAEDLRKYGATRLTPAKAAAYINAFINPERDDLLSDAEAWQYLTNPPKNDLNWWFTRDEINTKIKSTGIKPLAAANTTLRSQTPATPSVALYQP